jgi:hypothetical protein
MADHNSSGTPQDAPARESRREGSRGEGGRGPGGGRETGGFRIRLSDNELRAARAVQEAFQLRSTVAALGFSIRTIAQLLEQGQLDELVAQQRAAGGERPRRGPAGEGREARGDSRPGPRGERRGSRPDPFARPSRPQPEPSEPSPESPTEEPEASSQPEAFTEPEAAREVVISEPDTIAAPEEPSGTPA